MKNYVLIFLVIKFYNSLLAQRDNLQLEILLQKKDAYGETYSFKIEPVSGKTTWSQTYEHDWYIVTNATSSTEVIQGNHCWSDDYGFRVYVQPHLLNRSQIIIINLK